MISIDSNFQSLYQIVLCRKDHIHIEFYSHLLLWGPGYPLEILGSLIFSIHTDLNIPLITKLVKSKFQLVHSTLPNPLLQALASPHHPLHPPCRLNHQWPRDLLRSEVHKV